MDDERSASVDPANPVNNGQGLPERLERPGQQVRRTQAGMPLGVSVLVAVHDAESRRVIALALAEGGYVPHQVSDGAAALAFLHQARPPVVVIAEDRLPEIGGFQLAGILSLKRTEESRYSVVVMTADLRTALHHSLLRRLDAAALEVLVKPFHVNELLMAVALAAERLARPRLPAGPASAGAGAGAGADRT